MTRKISLQLRVGGILGAIGAGIGALIGSFWSSTYLNLAIGSLVGYFIGFIIGYKIGITLKEVGDNSQAERVASGAGLTFIAIGWLFVIASTYVLFIDGWNLYLFLSLLFFLMISLHLTYRRFKARILK